MKLKCINTIEEFKLLEKDWNNLVEASGRPSIFLTHHWFFSWWEAFHDRSLLKILVFYKNNNLQGIVPLSIKNKRLYFLASSKVSDYCDFIAAKGKEKEILVSFLRYLKTAREEIEAVQLINIPSDSSTYLLLPDLAVETGFRVNVSPSETVLRLEVPSSFEEFLSRLSRKSRHELRRKSRRLESLSSLVVEKINEPERIKKEIGCFIKLHRSGTPEREKFWGKKGMIEFFSNMSFRLTGWGKLELLKLFNGERPIAYLIQFLYDDTLSLYNVAYDREFSSLSPGIYLFQEAIRRAVERKVKIVDFLRGQEKYKISFSPKSDRTYNLTLISGD